MIITESQVRKLTLTNLERLDNVHVYTEDLGKGEGRITIMCYGKAWSAYWNAMGEPLAKFFCSCNSEYIINNLSDVSSEDYDLYTLQEQANAKGIDCWREDPWNDFEFMEAMYGSDMSEWQYQLPKMENSDYAYLRRIVEVVQAGLRELQENDKID